MTHTVTLTIDDQRLLIEAMACSQEYKWKKLQKQDSIDIMNKQYYDACLKFMEPITIAKRDNNIMTWFIDQMEHSGKFYKTELCERAILVARAVIRDEYQHYKSVQVFEDLFETDNDRPQV